MLALFGYGPTRSAKRQTHSANVARSHQDMSSHKRFVTWSSPCLSACSSKRRKPDEVLSTSPDATLSDMPLSQLMGVTDANRPPLFLHARAGKRTFCKGTQDCAHAALRQCGNTCSLGDWLLTLCVYLAWCTRRQDGADDWQPYMSATVKSRSSQSAHCCMDGVLCGHQVIICLRDLTLHGSNLRAAVFQLRAHICDSGHDNKFLSRLCLRGQL
jgi:hypothetical protein